MFYILSQNFAKVRKALCQFCASSIRKHEQAPAEKRGERRCFYVGFAALLNRLVAIIPRGIEGDKSPVASLRLPFALALIGGSFLLTSGFQALL